MSKPSEDLDFLTYATECVVLRMAVLTALMGTRYVYFTAPSPTLGLRHIIYPINAGWGVDELSVTWLPRVRKLMLACEAIERELYTSNLYDWTTVKARLEAFLEKVKQDMTLLHSIPSLPPRSHTNTTCLRSGQV